MSQDNQSLEFNQFESIKFYFNFQDLTTHTKIKKPDDVQLIEVSDKGFILELPLASTNQHHNVLVEIFQWDESKQEHISIFKATGKVLQAEPIDKIKLRVSVNLIQFDEKSWKEFLKIYSSRQDDINDFFLAVKG